MSRQYDKLIQFMEAENISTQELVEHNKGRIRPDLIGDNDVA